MLQSDIKLSLAAFMSLRYQPLGLEHSQTYVEACVAPQVGRYPGIALAISFMLMLRRASLCRVGYCLGMCVIPSSLTLIGRWYIMFTAWTEHGQSGGACFAV
jgi:hypothetical protein